MAEAEQVFFWPADTGLGDASKDPLGVGAVMPVKRDGSAIEFMEGSSWASTIAPAKGVDSELKARPASAAGRFGTGGSARRVR